jgi:hypothetical protein
MLDHSPRLHGCRVEYGSATLSGTRDNGAIPERAGVPLPQGRSRQQERFAHLDDDLLGVQRLDQLLDLRLGELHRPDQLDPDFVDHLGAHDHHPICFQSRLCTRRFPEIIPFDERLEPDIGVHKTACCFRVRNAHTAHLW